MQALVDYGSDGSGAGSEGEEPALKRARLEAARPAAPAATPPLLPPADALLDGSYSPPPAAAQRALEQTILHQGRERAFPHVTGNFATHVYLEVPTPPSCLGTLEELLQLLKGQLPDLEPVVHSPSSGGGGGGLVAASKPACEHASAQAAVHHGAPPAALMPATSATTRAACTPHATTAGSRPTCLAQPLYHVSLSRTVPLRLHQLQPLVEELRRHLRQQDTFQIRLARLVIFCNDARTRTFLAVAAEEVDSSSDGSSSSWGEQLVLGCAAGAQGDTLGAHAAERRDGNGGDELRGSSELESRGMVASGAASTGAAPASTSAQHFQRPNYCGQLVQMCHAASNAFAAHGLARFYADPQPHASIAWLLGDQQQQLESAIAAPAVLSVARRLHSLSWRLQPAAVVCKAGQRETSVWPVTSS